MHLPADTLPIRPCVIINLKEIPMPNRRFFTANQLKAIAMFCMLLDHMWATIVPGREWMTCVGRIAFPIFAFELAQG